MSDRKKHGRWRSIAAALAIGTVAFVAARMIRGDAGNVPDLVIKPVTGGGDGSPHLHHDFGVVISAGEPLRHRFRLRNGSGRPLRVVGKTTSSSCCLEIGALPDSIDPGRDFVVPVLARTAGRTGALRGDFAIRLDRPDDSIITLSLAANLLPDQEFIPTRTPVRLAIGQSAEARWSLVVRRRAGSSFAWPAPSGMSARYDGDGEGREISPTIIEYRRQVVAVVAASPAPGLRSSEFDLRWDDGRHTPQSLRWEVMPSLTPLPAAFVIDRSQGVVERTATITSSAGPFRIESVAGPAVVGHEIVTRPDAATLKINLRLDPMRMGNLSSVTIRTDRADAREVVVNLIATGVQPIEGKP